MYPERLGQDLCAPRPCFLRLSTWTFLPQFRDGGARGMARGGLTGTTTRSTRIYHQLSTIGAFVLGISIFISVGLSVRVVLERQRRPPRQTRGGASSLELAGADAAAASTNFRESRRCSTSSTNYDEPGRGRGRTAGERVRARPRSSRRRRRAMPTSTPRAGRKVTRERTAATRRTADEPRRRRPRRRRPRPAKHGSRTTAFAVHPAPLRTTRSTSSTRASSGIWLFSSPRRCCFLSRRLFVAYVLYRHPPTPRDLLVRPTSTST